MTLGREREQQLPIKNDLAAREPARKRHPCHLSADVRLCCDTEEDLCVLPEGLGFLVFCPVQFWVEVRVLVSGPVVSVRPNNPVDLLGPMLVHQVHIVVLLYVTRSLHRRDSSHTIY
eukprot:scaffold15466_cov181-Skeletonema_menzelii.AAC.2